MISNGPRAAWSSCKVLALAASAGTLIAGALAPTVLSAEPPTVRPILAESPRPAPHARIGDAPASCTCASPHYDSPERAVTEALTSAEVVLLGEVVAILTPAGKHCERVDWRCADEFERGGRTLVGLDDLTVTLAIESSWKGVEDGAMTITLTTRNQESACGYPFELGRRYLVYARDHDDDGQLSANYCARTRAVEEAGFDIRVLGGTVAVRRS